jgi:uncharacterized protein (TIGR02001 family)
MNDARFAGLGEEMEKLGVVAMVADGLLSTSAVAADMSMLTKAPPAAAPVSPWDFAFGSATMSDYVFRGISQSNRKASLAGYSELRYNFNDSLQAYVGSSGESIDFPNRAAAEIDFYGGIRPTFGKLALDFGYWYYWYPGGQCFNDLLIPDCLPSLPNGNVVKQDLSFWEVYGKATYNFTDAFSIGGSVNYSPSVLNSGADGTFINGNLKYTLPTALPYNIGWFISGDVGHWFLGTTDSFYCTTNIAGTACGGAFPNGIPYKSYTTWDVGLSFTMNQFTLDLRYYDTDLSKGDCNAFTSAQTGGGTTNVTGINPSGVGSSWCGATFVAKFSVDLVASKDLK